MSKKKHPEHVNHERWLVSYADFITLLFAFFVVLFASGQNDKRKAVMLAHSMQSAFDHNGIFDPHSKTPPISDDPGPTPKSVPSPMGLPLPTIDQPDIAAERNKQTETHIKQVIQSQEEKHRLAENVISVHTSVDGLVVSLREAGFFASGSADLRDESVGMVQAIASALPSMSMRVEGHTDNVPIHTAQFATNWELSTARAATITRLLISLGAASPEHISAAGYAEFQPVASNSTDAGRTQNRRVDIVLLKPAAEPATPPLPAPSR